MQIVILTAFLSVLLAGFFVFLFLRDSRGRTFGGAERASLLPLTGEDPAETVPATPGTAHGARAQSNRTPE